MIPIRNGVLLNPLGNIYTIARNVPIDILKDRVGAAELVKVDGRIRLYIKKSESTSYLIA